jgi:hypothetical protein
MAGEKDTHHQIVGKIVVSVENKGKLFRNIRKKNLAKIPSNK